MSDIADLANEKRDPDTNGDAMDVLTNNPRPHDAIFQVMRATATFMIEDNHGSRDDFMAFAEMAWSAAIFKKQL